MGFGFVQVKSADLLRTRSEVADAHQQFIPGAVTSGDPKADQAPALSWSYLIAPICSPVLAPAFLEVTINPSGERAGDRLRLQSVSPCRFLSLVPSALETCADFFSVSRTVA